MRRGFAFTALCLLRACKMAILRGRKANHLGCFWHHPAGLWHCCDQHDRRKGPEAGVIAMPAPRQKLAHPFEVVRKRAAPILQNGEGKRDMLAHITLPAKSPAHRKVHRA